jgi:hypothetical protein
LIRLPSILLLTSLTPLLKIGVIEFLNLPNTLRINLCTSKFLEGVMPYPLLRNFQYLPCNGYTANGQLDRWKFVELVLVQSEFGEEL